MPPQQAAASGSRGSQSGEQWQGPCAQEPMWPVFPGGQCQQGRGPATGHVEPGPRPEAPGAYRAVCRESPRLALTTG